jgi:hypothetical protein
MRPIHPNFRAVVRAQDSPIRTLVEAQAVARSASKHLRSDFEAADGWVLRSHDFPAGNALTAIGHTCEVTLTPGGQSSSGFYDLAYTLTMNLVVPPSGINTHRVSVAVEVDVLGTGTWVWQCEAFYEQTRKTGEPNAPIVWPRERQVANVVGLSTSSKMRLRVASASGPGGWEFRVHGFNAATDGDPVPGVRYHTGPGIALQDAGATILA